MTDGADDGLEWPSLPRETLASRALRVLSAEQRAAELESRLEAAHEELLRRENEIVSLQQSLELSAGENSRLSDLLDEQSAAAEKEKSRLGRLAKALAKEKRERDEANERREAETSELSIRLEAALARAINAEKLLAEAQRDLSTRNTANNALERKIADAAIAVQEKEYQIDELTRSRSTLIDELSRLQAISKVRDAELARAKENQSLLADLIVQLEAKLQKSKCDAKISEGKPRLAQAWESVGNGGRTSSAILKNDLDRDTWLLGPLPPLSALNN
jgi:chromosome segregation ATPase